MRKQRIYDKEFRINAVKHYESSGKTLREVAESFFHTLKTEDTYLKNFRTREDARSSIFEYIEVFYNRKRAHSFLDYLSPEEFKRNYNKGLI